MHRIETVCQVGSNGFNPNRAKTHDGKPRRDHDRVVWAQKDLFVLKWVEGSMCLLSRMCLVFKTLSEPFRGGHGTVLPQFFWKTTFRLFQLIQLNLSAVSPIPPKRVRSTVAGTAIAEGLGFNTTVLGELSETLKPTARAAPPFGRPSPRGQRRREQSAGNVCARLELRSEPWHGDRVASSLQ